MPFSTKLAKELRRVEAGDDGLPCWRLQLDPWTSVDFPSRSAAKTWMKRHWREIRAKKEAWDW